MKAMILAAGFGTRLGDLTGDTPKCLVEIGGKPMIEWVVRRLLGSAVSEVVVNLHYLSEQVISFFESRNNFGIPISFSPEEEILGTGGGIKHARKFLEREDYFLVHNADIYSEIDLLELVRRHKNSQNFATLAVRDCSTSRYLACTAEGFIKGWANDETGRGNITLSEGLSKCTYTGVQVVSAKALDILEMEDGKFSFFTPYMKAVERGELLGTFSTNDYYWIDVGTPGRMEEVNARLRDLSNREVSSNSDD